MGSIQPLCLSIWYLWVLLCCFWVLNHCVDLLFLWWVWQDWKWQTISFVVVRGVGLDTGFSISWSLIWLCVQLYVYHAICKPKSFRPSMLVIQMTLKLHFHPPVLNTALLVFPCRKAHLSHWRSSLFVFPQFYEECTGVLSESQTSGSSLSPHRASAFAAFSEQAAHLPATTA